MVYPEAMRLNLEKSRGMVYSQTLLLALVRSGLTREEAYALVQENAMAVWDGRQRDLLTACLADERIRRRLGEAKVRQAFDLKRLLRSSSAIVRRGLRLR